MSAERPVATYNSLLAQCRELALRDGDTVMLHASLRAVGPILGGPDVLINALYDAVGESGTLMMYVGCQPPYDAIGRNRLSDDDETFAKVHLPPFDPAEARADRDYGALAELFRTNRGVRCSANPGARMAALGGQADWLTTDHPLNYGYGPGSPLAKLCKTGGKVLLIGSDTDEVTLLHYAEHLAPIPKKRVVRMEVPMVTDDGATWVEIEEFDTSSTGIVDWPDRFFATIVEDFRATRNIRSGHLGQANVDLFDAQALVDHAIPLMVHVATENEPGD